MSAADHIDGPIWTWPRRGGGMFIAGYRPFKGQERFDLRLWVEGPDGLIPTGKGVNLPSEAAEDLTRALAAYAASRTPVSNGG